MLKRVQTLIIIMLFGVLRQMIPENNIDPMGCNQLEGLKLPIVFNNINGKDEITVYDNGLALVKKDKGHGEPHKSVFPVLKAKLFYRFADGSRWTCSDYAILDQLDAEMVLWDYANYKLERNAHQRHYDHCKAGIDEDDSYDTDRYDGIGIDHKWYLASDYMNPEIEYLKYERKKAVQEAISKLNDKQKKVIQLYFYEDMTMEEISEVVEKAVSTVHYRLYRGLEELSHLF
ncbi:MAG: sigma-70 family RNA polymerase sigma factor [Lachnospiraceae bacterium]|nr:sigma-70 family RNA polymerase sigma factor [Lachnospiraceae bacterium]